ncbi:MAG: hypothetical protein QXQ40_02515 [Candidatus Aenigmatarchaeota archaeon]
MIFGAGLDTAIAILLCMVLAHHVQLTKKIEKAFKWIGAGAVSFVIAGIFEQTPYISVWITAYGTNYGVALFAVIGWILVLIGGLKVLYQLLAE